LRPLEDCARGELGNVGAKAVALGEALRQGLPVPPGVAIGPDEDPPLGAIRSALGPGPFAVRSSSPSEDGADRSWSGQFESLIPVQADELGRAIEVVRASGSSERARAYGSDGRPIPVLVQPVVPANAAGIAFSLDPLDGDERYCVVEAVPGLATALADGTTTPSRWRIPIATGPADETAAGPLSAKALDDVVTLVLEVAGWLGRPCDVEWAWDGSRIWLVQARPVTAACWTPAPGQWTAANVRENAPGVVTPLAAAMNYEDVMPANIEGAMRRVGILRDGEHVAEATRFYGHLYWRVDGIKDRLMRLPGFVEASFDDTVGIRPSYEGSGRRSQLTPRTAATAARAAVTMVRGYREEGPRALRHAAEVVRQEPEWLSLDWDELGAAELERRLAAARDLHRATAYHHFIVTFAAEIAQDALRGLVEKAAERLEGAVDQRLLLSGVGRVATAATGDALAALAGAHVGSIDAILSAESIEALPADVSSGLQSVVSQFGWMAPADDELAHPRWDEDPQLALALFKGSVRAAAIGKSDRREVLGTARAVEEQRILAAAGLMRPALGTALRLSRRYQRIREELRVTWARMNRIMRRAFLAQGRRWTADGVLEMPEDVFWLTSRDCDRVLTGELRGAEVRALVAARRAHARRFRNWEPPLVLGAASEFEHEEPIADDGELRGVPCSSGVARGAVAILHRLEDVASVEPGSILVIKNGSPGWTPAFLVAGGLIVEEGGLLSHSSVVAREHGLPTVINVAHAMGTLHNGQMVEVDGRCGRIALLDARSIGSRTVGASVAARTVTPR